MDRSLNPNMLRNIRAIGLGIALSIGASACSGSETPKPQAREAESSTVAPPTIPTTLRPPKSPEADMLDSQTQERQVAEQYILSAERNDRINTIVQDAGQRFVVACQTGEAGPCDIYSGANNA